MTYYYSNCNGITEVMTYYYCNCNGSNGSNDVLLQFDKMLKKDTSNINIRMLKQLMLDISS